MPSSSARFAIASTVTISFFLAGCASPREASTTKTPKVDKSKPKPRPRAKRKRKKKEKRGKRSWGEGCGAQQLAFVRCVARDTPFPSNVPIRTILATIEKVIAQNAPDKVVCRILSYAYKSWAGYPCREPLPTGPIPGVPHQPAR